MPETVFPLFSSPLVKKRVVDRRSPPKFNLALSR